MKTEKLKWVVYEFRDGQHVTVSKPQKSKQEAEKLRDQMNESGRYGRNSLGVGTIAG
jgi:hypothetical protein